MKPILEILEERISKAIARSAGQDGSAIVKAATDSKFGDYQANGVMAVAKKLKTNPRKLAEEVVKNLEISDICAEPEIAGPGFINLRLKPEFLAGVLLEIAADDERLGVDKISRPENIVVDFSGPNIAKQMHVGHLRSTVIGDCICRVLEFLGHDVIRQNHIGDWGTQFGMLCARFDKIVQEARRKNEMINRDKTLADIEGFYREAQNLYQTDKEFVKTARAAVVGLHTGNKIWIAYWEGIVKTTSKHFREIYNRLGIILRDEHIRGESFYKDMLADVVEDLEKAGLAEVSDGAVCVFLEGFKNKEGDRLPFIIRKSDGAFLYATTDLAAIRYRVDKLKADRIIYVTDARQKLHFEMLFATAKAAGWTPENVGLAHVTFGSVLGEDGKPFKTRSGESVKLQQLLAEAVSKARAVVEEKNSDLPNDKKDAIAEAVGIGAVKYADYSNNRTSDYIFSFEKMLAMEGNTAPYMQYAYARIKSIERKAFARKIDVERELEGLKNLNLAEPAELDLAKQLIRYTEAITTAVADYRPNYITAYLYELAQKFSSFYNACPVLDAEENKRPTRLLLCRLTARTIRHGLEKLLGIGVIDQM